MPEIDDAKNALTELGWSEYESRTYSALVKHKRATASKIAKSSDVPPNRVYQILNKLSEKGYVRKMDSMGSTTEYEAVDPEDILRQDSKEYEKMIENAINALDELKERTGDENRAITFTIYGRREMNSYMRRMVLSTNKSVFLAVDTLLEIKHGELQELLNENSSELDIKILTTPRGVDNEYEMEVRDNLSDNIEVRISEDEFSTVLMICDGDIMLHTVYGTNEFDTDDIDYYGVYTQDKNTVKMFERTFIRSWKESADEDDEEDEEDDKVDEKGDAQKEREDNMEEKKIEKTTNEENVDDVKTPSSGPSLG